MDQTNRETYEDIAKEFSATRHTPWKCVRDFASQTRDKTVLEVGCGNGKNMAYLQTRHDAAVIGVDTCRNFVDMCEARGLMAVVAAANSLPFPSSRFDAVLCIAMFHHLLTDQDRDAAFREMIRVLKPGGRGILTCWSTIQPNNSKFTFTEGLNVVPWNKKQTRHYYVWSETMFRNYFESFEITIERIYNECGNWILLFHKPHDIRYMTGQIASLTDT